MSGIIVEKKTTIIKSEKSDKKYLNEKRRIESKSTLHF